MTLPEVIEGRVWRFGDDVDTDVMARLGVSRRSALAPSSLPSPRVGSWPPPARAPAAGRGTA